MLEKLFTGLVFAALGAGAMAEDIELTVGYPYDIYFKNTHRQIASTFMKENPGVKVKFRAAYDSYEDAAETVLSETKESKQPDVSFQALNRVRLFLDREKQAAVQLDKFIANDDDLKSHGIDKAMLTLGQHNEHTYALPFTVSMPVVYVNVDLLRAADYTHDFCPQTWDDIIEAAVRIDKLPKATGVFFGWDMTGNWLNQALVFSRGGMFMSADEKTPLLDNKENLWAMNTLARLVNETEMQSYSWKEANAEFGAGRLGMYVWSTSSLKSIDRLRGSKFQMRTCGFPIAAKDHDGARLPVGGSAVMIHTTDEAKQKIAWKYVKAVTSAAAAKVIAETTGYAPANSEAMQKPEWLAKFYEQHSKHKVASKQLGLATPWYAWPGENAIKITEVIKAHSQTIVDRSRANDVESVITDMQKEVLELLPNAP